MAGGQDRRPGSTLQSEVRPVGPVTEAVEPIPVRMIVRWRLSDMGVTPVEGVAEAWTAGEVRVRVTPAWVCWVPAADVERL